MLYEELQLRLHLSTAPSDSHHHHHLDQHPSTKEKVHKSKFGVTFLTAKYVFHLLSWQQRTLWAENDSVTNKLEGSRRGAVVSSRQAGSQGSRQCNPHLPRSTAQTAGYQHHHYFCRHCCCCCCVSCCCYHHIINIHCNKVPAVQRWHQWPAGRMEGRSASPVSTPWLLTMINMLIFYCY